MQDAFGRDRIIGSSNGLLAGRHAMEWSAENMMRTGGENKIWAGVAQTMDVIRLYAHATSKVARSHRPQHEL